MIKNSTKIAIIGIFATLLLVGCSNKKNTVISRNYQALATHYNVYFNGKESLKEGIAKIEKAHKENYAGLLPVFIYEDKSARKMAMSSMDRAIEKSIKGIKLHSITRKPKRKKKKNKSAKYIAFRKKNEYNKWIDDCYLLMGKARFYKGDYHVAEKTFDFIVREYPQSKLIPQAKLWKAASLIDRGELLAGREQLDRIGATKALSKKDLLWIRELRVDIAIKEKNYVEGIRHLQGCIQQSKNKKKKARFYFLIAQLNQKIGNKAGAAKAFQDLIALKAGYEITFNANINQALSYTGGNGEVIREKLNKMLKDDKNTEYQDQIYFALAEMDRVDNNMPKAIENYWKATKVSVQNNNQKAIAFLKLGDYYFNDSNFIKAQVCYDSSMTYLGSEYPNYIKISDRVERLTELVTNLNTVTREDSLQMVAKMPKKEREKLIAGIIQKIKDKEEEEKQRIAEAQSDRFFYRENQMLGDNRNHFNRNMNSSNQGGDWYFYNPTNVGLGKSEFRRKWGRRKLEDNWRRKNKKIFEADDPNFADAGSDAEKINAKDKGGDPKSTSYYLDNLPLTPEAVVQSNKRIMKALYQAALVYRDKLHKNDKALEQLQELLRRFPENPYLLSAYYQLYAVNKEMGNSGVANNYKQKIITQFADSEYAKALLNPNYRNKLAAQDSRANSLYATAFQKFKNFYYYEVIRICKEGVLQYPESSLKPRFLFLQAIAVGRTQSVENFSKALNNVLDANPPKEIAKTVNAISESLEKGEKPKIYSQQDMNIARQKQQLRNWRLDVIIPMEKQVEKESEKEEQAPLYAVESSEPHWFVLIFNQRDANANKVVFNFAKYNANTYKSQTFDVSKKTLGKKVMVIVKELKNQADALSYFKRIINNSDAYSGLEQVNYRNFIITPDNLQILEETKDVEEYLDFYTKRYFNVERKRNKQEKVEINVSAKQPKVNSSDVVKKNKIPEGEYKFNKHKPHCFVIIYPINNGDSQALIAGIKKHNTRYLKTKVQKFDEEYDILLVSNMQDKKQAMMYFKAAVNNRNLFAPIEKTDYRNFIISNENLKLLLQKKDVDAYISFFKKNYLK